MLFPNFLKGVFLFLFVMIVSCDDEGSGPSTSKREVKFEVTGNFTGTLSAGFITESGGGTTESIPSLPWTKSLTYQSSVPSTIISVAGIDGVSGQTLTIKVSAGGKVISSTPGTADNYGSIVISAPSLIF